MTFNYQPLYHILIYYLLVHFSFLSEMVPDWLFLTSSCTVACSVYELSKILKSVWMKGFQAKFS